MLKNSRVLDVILLLVVAAAGAFVYTRPKPAPAPTAVPSVSAPTVGQARPFRLPRLKGEDLVYKKGGPALITLSAVGCAGCRQRVPTDTKAYALARQSGVPVWNIFVYANAAAGAAFQAELQPMADEFIYDTDGRVSVNTYGGSDSSCWILIDRQGQIVYRAGSDLAALEEKLKQIK